MSTTEFYFFVALMFGFISALVGGLLALGHRRLNSATGRRRSVYAVAVKGFQPDTARNMLIFGCLLLAVGAIGVAATR